MIYEHMCRDDANNRKDVETRKDGETKKKIFYPIGVCTYINFVQFIFILCIRKCVQQRDGNEEGERTSINENGNGSFKKC